MKVIYTTTWWPGIGHHSALSGYQRLVHHIDLPKTLIISKMFEFGPPLVRSQLRKVRTELQAFSVNGDIVHHLYGEETYLSSPIIKRVYRHKRLVVTFHYPSPRSTRLGPRFEQASLNAADLIITVSKNQQTLFRSMVRDPDKVHFIPHGVEAGMFERSNFSKRNCLMVGLFLRDYDIAIKAMRELWNEGVNLNFDIVVPKVIAKKGEELKKAGPPNLRLHVGVSDEQLMKLYSSSRIFLQTLTDVTASNAILEAMASGLPIVVTDVGGARDYLNERAAIFVPKNNTRAVVNALRTLAVDDELCRRMGNESRRLAEQFSWDKIAKTYLLMYHKIIDCKQ